MSKVGSVSVKMIYIVMIMMLLLSAVPAMAASSAPVGQDNIPPPAETPGDGAVEASSAIAQSPLNPAALSIVPAAAIAAGQNFACALTSGGAVQCWGSNIEGQLGNGDNTDSHTRVNVSGLSSGVKAISAGEKFACAILSSGAVKCWGFNTNGELGNSSNTNSNVPVPVNGLSSGVTAIGSGTNHTCAMLTGGAVKCWGMNNHGQLGDNTTTSSNVPVTVGSLGGTVTSIDGGWWHTCALFSTHTVKCWGNNANGQLGDNTQVENHVPTIVKDVAGTGTLSSVQSLGVGRSHNCALLSGGELQCWGNNEFGQLGNNATANTQKLPVVVTGLGGVISNFTLGAFHTCVVLITGAAQCWGSNFNSEIGDGVPGDDSRLQPVDVSGLSSGVQILAGGSRNTYAVMTAGYVKAWGDNGDLNLGTGSATPSVSNVPLDTLGYGPAPTYSISGTITHNNSGLNGVTVSVTGGSGTTNGSGVYSVTGLVAGTYTVTPTLSGYSFTPASRSVTITSSNVTGIDFTATAVASTYSIGGTITLNGNGLAGVTVTAGSKTYITNSKGGYLLSGLVAGTYTVNPTLSGYSFTPASKAVTITSSNVVSQDFSASKSVTPGINSHFQGSKTGWTAIHGGQGFPSSWLWGVNSTALYSPILGNGYATIAYTPRSYSNLDYSVRFQRLGCNLCATSVYIRGTAVSVFGNWTKAYQFSITRSGSYLVAKNVFARLVPIQNWKASPYINQGSAWNVLRVVAVGSSLKFYINGHLVWSGSDSTYSSGKVGIGFSSNGSGGVNRMYVDYATLTVP